MACAAGPDISESGLVLALDAGNTKGYDNDENLFLYSEQYNELSWINQASSETINTTETLSPDGTYNATKLFGNNGATARQSIYQAVSVTSGITYTFSVFLKQGQRRYATIWFDSANVSQGAFRGAGSIIDLQTGTLATGNETIIVPYSNGWYRCYVTATPTATQSMNFNLSVGGPNNNNGAPYDATGDGSSGIYIGRSQFEIGTLTDYTPTTTTAKNRGSTLIDLSGNGNTGTLINGPTYNSANGGSLVFDATNDYITSLFATTSGQAVTYIGWLYSTETTATYRNFVDSVTARPMIWWNNSGQIEFDAAFYTTTTVYRNQWVYVALSKPSGSSSASYYVNGVLVGTGTAYTTPAVTPTWFNRAAGQTWKGNCSYVQAYNRALTAQEVQQNFIATRSRFST